ncbi:MAG: DUF4126 family protein [Gammaproteobacteria bacterium]|nr:DUF4126 family protein [Gammaproteobacteria bacterium]
MESYDALLATLALTMGASWASGINLYAALLVLGIGASTGNIDLPPDLQTLADPMVIGAAGLMYFIEFFVDKTPGVDSGWDTLHTFIRIPAGALLAAGAVGDVSPALGIAAGVMGGSLATVSHATKAGSRVLINTSPEPFSNWTASLTEDVLVIGGLWTALAHPLVFLCLLALFLLAAIWLLPKLWRLLRAVAHRVGRFLGLVDKPDSVPNPDDDSATASPFSDPSTEQGSAGRSGHSAAASSPHAEQLRALDLLRQTGRLSEEEFARTRAKILSPQ